MESIDSKVVEMVENVLMVPYEAMERESLIKTALVVFL